MIEKRIKEAEKLGYEICIIPESNKKHLKQTFENIELIGVKNVNDAINYLKLKE